MRRCLSFVPWLVFLVAYSHPVYGQVEGGRETVAVATDEDIPVPDEPIEDLDPAESPLITREQVERRLAAIRRLGELGQASSFSILTRVLRVDPVLEARVAAVEALASLGTEATRLELLRIANHGLGHNVTRRAAELSLEIAPTGASRALALRELQTRIPISTVVRLLRTDRDDAVRLEALRIMSIHGHWPDFDEDIDRLMSPGESEAIQELAAELDERQRTERAVGALRLAGPVVLGLSYGIDVLASLGSILVFLGSGRDATARAALRLLVPIAGPIWAAQVGRYNDVVAYSVLGWLDAVLQVVGLTMTILAVVLPRRARRRRAVRALSRR